MGDDEKYNFLDEYELVLATQSIKFLYFPFNPDLFLESNTQSIQIS